MRNSHKHSAFCALLIAILASFMLGGCGPAGQSASSNEQSAVKTNISTPVPLASPTPIVPMAGPAVLGGQLGAFVHKFGDPNNDSDPSFDSYSFKRYSASKTDYLRVVGDIGDGQQWTPFVYLIVVAAPPHQPWDSSTADALCASFLPLDARYVSQSLGNGKQGTTQGINILYYSAMLKATLPSTQFSNALHAPVESGLLDIYYSFVNTNLNSIDSCTLVPGTLSS